NTAQEPLHDVPAVVFSTSAPVRLKVDLLTRALADIRDVEIAGLTVEGEPPRVPQSFCPDLLDRRSAVGKRIGGGYAVERRPSRVGFDVQTKNLPEEHVISLRAAGAPFGPPTIADSDIEVTVGSELEISPEVIGIGWMRDPQKHDSACAISVIGFLCQALVASNRKVTGLVGVRDEEEPVGPVIGIKGGREQP